MGGFDEHNKDDLSSTPRSFSSSSFGLREAIHEAEMQRENDIQVQAQTLFNNMKVLQKVRKATTEGKREVSIDFPKTKRFGPETTLKKGISGADVVIALMAMISEDMIVVGLEAGQTGGCCHEPDAVMMYSCPDRSCSQVLPESRIESHIEHHHRFYSCRVCSDGKSREEHEFVGSENAGHEAWRKFFSNKQEMYGGTSSLSIGKAPMFRTKTDLEQHIAFYHAFFCRPCAVYLGRDPNGHLWMNHSEERRKGLFGTQRVQTMTIHELERVEEPYADLVKEWRYSREAFKNAGKKCKNCGGKFKALSRQDHYISMKLTW